MEAKDILNLVLSSFALFVSLATLRYARKQLKTQNYPDIEVLLQQHYSSFHTGNRVHVRIRNLSLSVAIKEAQLSLSFVDERSRPRRFRRAPSLPWRKGYIGVVQPMELREESLETVPDAWSAFQRCFPTVVEATPRQIISNAGTSFSLLCDSLFFEPC